MNKIAKYNKEQTIEILKLLLKNLIDDRNISIERRYYLDGFCFILSDAGINLHDIPELIELKPKKTFRKDWWWTRDPHSMTRINKVKKLIEKLEKEN